MHPDDDVDEFIFVSQVAKIKFDPELVVYNAGTDILDGDPLGRLKVSFAHHGYINFMMHILLKYC